MVAKGIIYRSLVALFLGLSLVIFVAPFFNTTQAADHFPRLANYYLRWDLPESKIAELAKWDVLILDMETQVRSRELLKKLRELNPRIILLVYITSQEIRQDGYLSQSVLRSKLAKELPDEWFLTKSSGQRISFWPGTFMLNVADNCPLVNGERFGSVLARFVATELLSTGLWDGVFYDNAWDGITWYTGEDVDLDRDGMPDAQINDHWQSGMKFLFNETRRLAGNNTIIVGNGGAKVYRDEMNGTLLENFPNHGGWSDTMGIYRFFENGKRTPQVIVLNRTTLNSGRRANYASMRFGLASALLGNGYYSFDYGDQEHGQEWWYDEYDTKLGEPTGPPTAVGGGASYLTGVWRREYEHGLALVNGAEQPQDVDLGGEYEKIIGRQDPAVNDGSITDRVHLAAHDGLVMYKTFRSLNQTLFRNGSFVRFFRADGSRARNGYFAFEEGYTGGAKIFNGDLDGDGRAEKIVVTGSKLEIFNSLGERWFNDYPFGSNYTGELQVAVGKIFAGPSMELLVAPATRGGKIVVYNYHGELIRNDWYPLGKRYQGGFSVGINSFGEGGRGEVILGAKKGLAAEIIVYNYATNTIKKRFAPFGRDRLPAGVNLAVGNLSGQGVGSIAVLSAKTKSPKVRQFSLDGKMLKEFSIRGIFGTQQFSIGISDGSPDNHAEIIVMSGN